MTVKHLIYNWGLYCFGFLANNVLLRAWRGMVFGPAKEAALKRGGPTFVVPTPQSPSRPVKQCLIAPMTTVLPRVPLVRNLSRQKVIAQFLIGLLKRRNVRFGEVAQHLNDAAKPASNENRIQHFFRDVD